MTPTMAEAASGGMPVRIQRKRTKGFRMPPNTVSVTRPSKWGNPHMGANAFRVWLSGNRGYCTGSETPEARDLILKNIRELRGSNLACWCKLCAEHAKGKPLGVECGRCNECHADVLLELANK